MPVPPIIWETTIVVSDMPQVIWHNLRQKPMLQRIFYVPFWECPYRCEDCCVDSWPGRPPKDLEAGEAMLFGLIAAQARHTGHAIALHIYGGEPLMRPRYLRDFMQRALGHAGVGKLYLYSTLRPRGIESVVAKVPKGRLRIVVNPDTANDAVHARMAALDGIAEFYRNPTIFHTGRGRYGADGYQEAWFERLLPAALPGRSCFATASGMLINGPHRSVHLCCLPQSPVVGHFNQDPSNVFSAYRRKLETFHREVRARVRAEGHVHACEVCEQDSAYDSTHHGPLDEATVQWHPRPQAQS